MNKFPEWTSINVIDNIDDISKSYVNILNGKFNPKDSFIYSFNKYHINNKNNKL